MASVQWILGPPAQFKLVTHRPRRLDAATCGASARDDHVEPARTPLAPIAGARHIVPRDTSVSIGIQ